VAAGVAAAPARKTMLASRLFNGVTSFGGAPLPIENNDRQFLMRRVLGSIFILAG
jgi:hypothetical protein